MCLSLKDKYPGLNCNEVLEQIELFKINKEDNRLFLKGDEKYSQNKTCNNISQLIERLNLHNTTLLSNITFKVDLLEDQDSREEASSIILSYNESFSKVNKTKEEEIDVNLNQTESSPLLSMKSTDDLTLAINIDNIVINETMGSEEFLSKMMNIEMSGNFQ